MKIPLKCIDHIRQEREFVNISCLHPSKHQIQSQLVL